MHFKAALFPKGAAPLNWLFHFVCQRQYVCSCSYHEHMIKRGREVMKAVILGEETETESWTFHEETSSAGHRLTPAGHAELSKATEGTEKVLRSGLVRVV